MSRITIPEKIQEIPLPEAIRIAADISPVSFADAFSMTIPGHSLTSEKIAHALFNNPPGYVRTLLRCRDALVKIVGLKTTSSIVAQAPSRGLIGIFPVVSSSAEITVLGLDDRHLDFRTCVLVRHEQDQSVIILSTVIRVNTFFGRCYLFLVRPFHYCLVKMALNRAARRLVMDNGI